MGIAGFGRSELPFDMFDLERHARDAARSIKLASMYHRGQQLAWDGREVLAQLIAKHGGVDLPEHKRDPLRRLFAIILWGELAAWKISAQLADRLVPLEAKLAATAQAHDEARHFYVMYDYLSQLGEVPREVDRNTRAILDMVLRTDSLLKKLIGMQLMVESLALTIFQMVREARCEPVLTDLLRYIEKDEARHVGLGVQYLPMLLRNATRRDAVDVFFFQMRIVAWTLNGLRELETDLKALDIDPRRIIALGMAKQMVATDLLWANLGIDKPKTRAVVERGLDACVELMFPAPDARAWRRRFRSAVGIWRAGGRELPRVTLEPT